jgi:hypothetical protein
LINKSWVWQCTSVIPTTQEAGIAGLWQVSPGKKSKTLFEKYLQKNCWDVSQVVERLPGKYKGPLLTKN